MAHRFLLLRVHLAEGDLEALGLEHRVEAEAALAADRPHQGALDAALEGGGGAVRPGDREIATEEAAAVGGIAEFFVHPPHGDEEVALRPRPAGGVDPRLPAEGRHSQRSEEHTSELQSLMRISYAVFSL